MKRLAILALKIGLATLISFLALEFLLLIFNDLVFRNALHVYDPDLGYRARAYGRWGENVTNEFGFNDRDYAHQRRPDTYRILILSDSFNWAGGLDQNYTAILERKFEAEFGPERVEIINAGYDGTHTGEQLKLLKKFGMRYRPDLVLLGFFVGNDFLDAQPWRKRVIIGGAPFDLDTRSDWEITLFGQLLVPQSRLYLFLKQKWLEYQFLRAQAPNEIQPLLQPETEKPVPQSASSPAQTGAEVAYTSDNISADYLELELRRLQVTNWTIASQYASHEFQSYERFVFDNLLSMRNYLAEEGVDFMVAAYPDNFQVDPRLTQLLFERYQLDPNQYQLDRPQGLLWQFCLEQNIEFYDLLPFFRQTHQEGQRLYIHNDSHWNLAGNSLAAEVLFEALVWKAREHLK